MLYTLAYPTLDEADRQAIEQIRSQYDAENQRIVAPHFTLVFGTQEIPSDQYQAHVAAHARTSSAIHFVCRYAMLNSTGETAYLFLVPDEGYSQLSLLHDRLYTGILADQLRLDIPFVPHITIGMLNDQRQAKQLCDSLNAQGITIRGKVEALTVSAFHDEMMKDLASFALRP